MKKQSQAENAQAQMAKQQPAQPAAKPAPDAQDVKMSFDVKVRKTGATKQVSGLDSKGETILVTADHDVADQYAGPSSRANMAIINDMWMVPAIPGYDQVQDFWTDAWR